MNWLVSKEEMLVQKGYSKKCSEILARMFPEKKPTFYLHSFGCQGNVSEGEQISGMLFKMGYLKTENLKEANFVIFNTCAVREGAQNRVFGNLGKLIYYKNKINKKLIIGLCGCMVQQEKVANKIRKVYPGVDLIFGTHVKHRLPEMVYGILKTGKGVCLIENSDGVITEGLPVLRESSFRAFVPISYGCNNFCTYCIVPYVKGRERSRNFEVVLDEIKDLVEKGYREIVLLGQNVNSYGKDLGLEFGFIKLLNEINKISKKFRVRFLTSHPKDVTKNLIDCIASCEKVCNHLHLPVQSGSNRILLKMNRHYSVERYLDIINYAKKTVPNIVFTTDIIVGFPGETYEDFKETISLVKKVKYSSIYSFIFSKRPGTKAANLEDLVSLEEKTRWLKELISCQSKISDCFNRGYVGRVGEVLVDGFSKTDVGQFVGRLDGNILVKLVGEGLKIGEFKNVKILESCRTCLIGGTI